MSPCRLAVSRTGDRRGQAFTLVELLVVVLIIGILAAIALPRFGGQRTRAKNAAAQAAVRHALVAARSYYTQNSESYAGLGPTQLQGYESSLSGSEPADSQTPGSGANPQDIWIGNGSNGVNPTSADSNGGKVVVLCSASRGDSIYCVRDSDGTANYLVASGSSSQVLAVAAGTGWSASGWATATPIASPAYASQGTEVSQYTSMNSVTMSPTLPASWAAGDFALCYAAAEAGTMSISAGWSSLSFNPISNSGSYKLYVWYRRLQAGDTDPVISFAGLDGTNMKAHVARVQIYSGVRSASPIDAVGTPNAATSSSSSTTGVTTGTVNAKAVTVLMIPGGALANNDGSLGGTASTKRLDIYTGSGGLIRIAAYDLAVLSPGSSGVFASTISSSQAWAGATFALAP